MKNAEGVFSLSPREERAGRETGERGNMKNSLLSPAPLLLFLGGEGEWKRYSAPIKLLAE